MVVRNAAVIEDELMLVDEQRQLVHQFALH